MNWDCNYDKSSQAATLFEAIYYALLSEVAGKHIFGDKTWHMMLNTTAILPFIHANLDTLILNDDSLLGSRNKLFKDIIERVLADYSNQTLNPWGKQQQFTLTNIYFDGKLPRWLGFDRGPYPLEGNRCTVSLGDIFYEGNRRLAGGSSYRFITEMSKDEVYSVLIGGASERRFSSHYISDLKRWLNHEYKITDMAKGAQ